MSTEDLVRSPLPQVRAGSSQVGAERANGRADVGGRTNPATQIEWSIVHPKQRYGSLRSAQKFKAGRGWY